MDHSYGKKPPPPPPPPAPAPKDVASDAPANTKEMMDVYSPVITSLSCDSTTYNPGGTITVTVGYSAGAIPSVYQIGVTASDPSSGLSDSGWMEYAVYPPGGSADPMSFSISDSGNRSWKMTSNNGSVAVFTAIA